MDPQQQADIGLKKTFLSSLQEFKLLPFNEKVVQAFSFMLISICIVFSLIWLILGQYFLLSTSFITAILYTIPLYQFVKGKKHAAKISFYVISQLVFTLSCIALGKQIGLGYFIWCLVAVAFVFFDKKRGIILSFISSLFMYSIVELSYYYDWSFIETTIPSYMSYGIKYLSIFIILLILLLYKLSNIDFINEEGFFALKKERELSNQKAFITGVSNSVKVPIRSLVSFQQIISQKISPTKEYKNLAPFLEKIDTSTNQIIRFVEDLEIYASLNAQAAFLRKVEVKKLLLFIKDKIKKTYGPLHFQLQIDDQIPAIISDEKQVSIVIERLMLDIFKPVDGAYGRTLRVYSFKKKNIFSLVFQDDGPGISTEVLQNIFEPFKEYKEDNLSQNLGLSLTICKKIMLSLQGDIIIESENGNGTRVILHIPDNLRTEKKI